MMTNPKRFLSLSAGLMIVMSLLATGLTPVLARQHPVATVIVIDGSLVITRASGDAEELTGDGVALVGVGDQVTVSESGEALITFFEGAESRLGPGAVAEVTELVIDDAVTEITLSLSLGQAINSVQTALDDDSHFFIDTPAATISVRGTEFVVFARENELTQVATTEGLVAVKAEGKTTEVPCGYGVKLLPGEAPGAVKVWGQSNVALTAPVGEVDYVSVTFVNRDNGQLFHYRTGDVMTVVLGNYDLVINTPAPHRIQNVPFGEDTQPEVIVPFEIAMSGMVLNLLDEGEVVNESAIYLRLLRDDGLEAESKVMPGEAFIVGPGVWSIEAALDDTFTHSQRLSLDVIEGETYTVPVDLAGFGE